MQGEVLTKRYHTIRRSVEEHEVRDVSCRIAETGE